MGQYDSTIVPTQGQFDKAAALLEAKAVHLIDCREYEVVGNNDTYKVRIYLGPHKDKPHTCTCPRVGTCSHIIAALGQDDFLVKAAAKRGHNVGPSALDALTSSVEKASGGGSMPPR